MASEFVGLSSGPLCYDKLPFRHSAEGETQLVAKIVLSGDDPAERGSATSETSSVPGNHPATRRKLLLGRGKVHFDKDKCCAFGREGGKNVPFTIEDLTGELGVESVEIRFIDQRVKRANDNGEVVEQHSWQFVLAVKGANDGKSVGLKEKQAILLKAKPLWNKANALMSKELIGSPGEWPELAKGFVKVLDLQVEPPGDPELPPFLPNQSRDSKDNKDVLAERNKRLRAWREEIASKVLQPAREDKIAPGGSGKTQERETGSQAGCRQGSQGSAACDEQDYTSVGGVVPRRGRGYRGRGRRHWRRLGQWKIARFAAPLAE